MRRLIILLGNLSPWAALLPLMFLTAIVDTIDKPKAAILMGVLVVIGCLHMLLRLLLVRQTMSFYSMAIVGTLIWAGLGLYLRFTTSRPDPLENYIYLNRLTGYGLVIPALLTVLLTAKVEKIFKTSKH